MTILRFLLHLCSVLSCCDGYHGRCKHFGSSSRSFLGYSQRYISCYWLVNNRVLCDGILIGAVVSRQDLLTKYTIMADIDLTGGFLVIGGVYAATFSSALASIVGAPQLLSSVARDELFGFLSYFKVTHKRDGFRFIKAPFSWTVSRLHFCVSSSGLFLLRLFIPMTTVTAMLCTYYYSLILKSRTRTLEIFFSNTGTSWKILRKLFVGRLDADKMKELIVKRGTSRVTGTTWTFQDKIETYTRKDMETLSSEELENILVDDLIDHLERPHQDVVESFTNYVVSACDKVDRGESDHATTGLVRARELKAIFQGQQNETPPPHDVSKLIESAKFNAEHMVTFLMNADMKDEPNRRFDTVRS